MVVMKSAAPALNSKFAANQKAFLFHSTTVLLSRRKPSDCASEGVYRAPQRRHKNFVRGFSNPSWKRILLRDPPSTHSNGLVQIENFYYTPYSGQSSSWFRQDYQATRFNAFGGTFEKQDSNNEYHACAMKWHPDHNQGLFKTIVEEKFKSCSAAYKSLCDMLAPNEEVC